MNKHELANEFRRLYSGFGKDPNRELTPERVHAMHERWGHLRLEAMQMAVQGLLAGLRFPTQAELENALESHQRSFKAIPVKSSWSEMGEYPGALSVDGSWDRGAIEWHPDLYRFVFKLVMGRRYHWPVEPPIKASPAYYVEMIRSSEFSETFGNVALWSHLDQRSDWPLAVVGNPAAEMLKRCGWGRLPGYWDEQVPGRWEPFKEALEAHRSKIGGNRGAILPPTATENGF